MTNEGMLGELLPALVEGEEALRRKELADRAAYSVSGLARRFRAEAGEPPASLVRRVRLERAAFRLRSTELTVAEIALEAGFSGATPFARAFRRAYGASPGEFRRAGGHVPLLPSTSRVHWHPSTVWRGPRRESPMIEPKIISFGAKRAAFRRHVGTTPDIAATWKLVNAETATRGLRLQETRYFTRFHDGPSTPPEEARSDVMFTLTAGQPIPEGYEETLLPEGEYAVFVHQGPDDAIGDTWARAFQEWLPQSGRAYDGVAFEEYVNGFYPRPEEPDEKLIVTAVYLKLAS